MNTGESFVKWRPSALMEWAKTGNIAGKYNLARSAVPSVLDWKDIPGGPIKPDLWGYNRWGHEGLKECVAALYATQSENVLLAQGASQCNYLIAGAALAGGGSAVVETPVYEPMLRGVEAWADKIVRLPRRWENGFQPDPDELRRIMPSDTRLIGLTNLHNPSHVTTEQERLKAIVDAADQAGAVVLVDEVFLPMLRRDHSTHGFAQGAISTNGLDKSWGLEAIRVGWAIGPKELIHRAYRLNNLMGVNQPYMTEDFAWRILKNEMAVKWLIARADRACQGRGLFISFLEQTSEVSCVLPDGGVSALIELPKGTDDRAFAADLLAEQDTVIFPGSYFECPGSIRVSFGGQSEEMREGLNRLSSAIRSIS